MVVNHIELKSFDEFDKYWNTVNSTGHPVYFFFSGKKDDAGKSWCPDCVIAEPVVKQYLSDIEKDLIFAYVDVGDPVYWRNVNCPFRTDNRLRLMQIPTIIKWKGVQRLEGSQCNKRDLLQMMFEEEEDN